MLILDSVFLFIAGLLMFYFPAVMYSITECWKNNSSGEPSEMYKLHIHIGGFVCLLVGIVGLLSYFV